MLTKCLNLDISIWIIAVTILLCDYWFRMSATLDNKYDGVWSKFNSKHGNAIGHMVFCVDFDHLKSPFQVEKVFGLLVGKFNDRSSSDLIIECQNEKFYVHQMILKFHSEYFKSILRNESAHNAIMIYKSWINSDFKKTNYIWKYIFFLSYLNRSFSSTFRKKGYKIADWWYFTKINVNLKKHTNESEIVIPKCDQWHKCH